MKKYRWGFVGSGGISNRAVKDIATLPQAEIYAIASRTKENSDAFARRYGLKHAYESVEALCRDPEVDIIYIGTPHVYHKEQALMALSYGKAVLCEKPMSISVADTKAMVEAAKKHSAFLMEALWTRFLPVIHEVKKWIEAGEIGKVLTVDANFCSKAEFNAESRIFNKKLGGGALLDLGVYPVSVSRFLLPGKIMKIAAKGKVGVTGVEEDGQIRLELADGAVINAHCSVVCSSTEAMTIIGTSGYIEIPFFWRATEAFLRREGKAAKEINGKESFGFQAQEVMRMLDTGRLQSPTMPWNDSLEIAQILEESRRQIHFS